MKYVFSHFDWLLLYWNKNITWIKKLFNLHTIPPQTNIQSYFFTSNQCNPINKFTQNLYNICQFRAYQKAHRFTLQTYSFVSKLIINSLLTRRFWMQRFRCRRKFSLNRFTSKQFLKGEDEFVTALLL